MGLASDLGKGKFFEYKGEIMQAVRKETVAYGTHSHSKLKLTVTDIKGKKEKVITLAHGDRVDILDIKKKTAQVISKTPKGVQIMDPYSYETLDATAEQEVINEINEGDEVIYVNYNNNVSILGKRRG
ncbi:MAG: hypothetical protein KAK00_07400 [Nanoarchaeota archaeon]|nr:hypothetical protein [Nanoarchaeota archaeon]